MVADVSIDRDMYLPVESAAVGKDYVVLINLVMMPCLPVVEISRQCLVLWQTLEVGINVFVGCWVEATV